MKLYYLGTNRVASWAIVTGAGIIQIDSLDDAEEGAARHRWRLQDRALTRPSMKYLILTHGHNDHFGGAKYLQETYHPRVLMSAADWDMVAKLSPPESGQRFAGAPAREMDITDGQKLTLWQYDAHAVHHRRPHSGTVSMLVPVTDHGRSHLLSFWAGSAIPRELLGRPARLGGWMRVCPQAIVRSIASSRSEKRPAWRGTSPISYRDQTFIDGKTDRIAALQARKPGGPHPFIDRGTYIRYFMISVECIEAQEGWVRAGKPSVGP